VYASPHVIISIIKSRKIKWAENVACMGDMRIAYSILVEKPERRDHLEDLGVDGGIMLEWMFGRVCTEWI
jgi:hypothetical protein